jgi:hypothetical protein
MGRQVDSACRATPESKSSTLRHCSRQSAPPIASHVVLFCDMNNVVSCGSMCSTGPQGSGVHQHRRNVSDC